MPTFLDNEENLPDPAALSAEMVWQAATRDGENPAPEVSVDTAGITSWDEPLPDTLSSRWPAESEDTDAARLVRAGSEEAAREHRAAVEVRDGDYPPDS